MVEQAPGDADEGISRQLIHLARFLGVLMISWALLYALWFAFPELRRDAEFAEAHKREGLRSRQIFAGDRPFRVAVFGNSRLLAAFQPERFDRLSGGLVESVNMAYPLNHRAVIEDLEQLLAQTHPPTHVLLTQCVRPAVPWYDTGRVMRRAFPFRTALRAAAQTLLSGDPAAEFEALRAQHQARQRQLDDARGYLFLESLSRFKGHRLPEGFRAHQPLPDAHRRCAPSDPAVRRLLALQARDGFDVWFVPVPGLEDPRREQPKASELNSTFEGSGVNVIGDDYWLTGGEHFADAVHMNPTGAAAYTGELWALLRSRFSRPTAPSRR